MMMMMMLHACMVVGGCVWQRRPRKIVVGELSAARFRFPPARREL